MAMRVGGGSAMHRVLTGLASGTSSLGTARRNVYFSALRCVLSVRVGHPGVREFGGPFGMLATVSAAAPRARAR